ncbi:DNA polymerase III subunit delta' [Vibrio cholerae]|uniref:DNA polymerase III subunit delta' n=1 Tax=Vibrio cholerae TaxID=666 RepID=UPI000E6D5194|nr:DNA polymerase III subunit delta' [Vibrio cholerae]EGR2848103.1 DNA polymerase III subunit delta' [Vibrio cholerae]EGR4048848.1 DNA polymerase III subunit delta' [Vibrio cholerae]EGR4252032.1 DNA polymerase III subunit delta' [Vibrio cholerae]EHR7681789.1 DNA polymerase III subunit delta' [Vibrio cholerae]EHT2842137.1 DNA polymerase III subunit delta' [Vibrio cholerae]
MSNLNSLYPWLVPVWQPWQAGLAAGKISSATLIQASEGLGAESLVELMARTLMCTSSQSEPCGFCHSCGLMQSGNHPDFHVVKPEKIGKSITVEQIRQMNRIAQESSQLSGYRLIVIEPADAMNESSANALLKTLEEPAPNCLFILVTSRIKHLLPTIVSRCQRLVLPAPTTALVVEWLKGQGITTPAYALHLCADSPLKTRAFMLEGGVEKYHELESQLMNALSGDVNAQLKCIALIDADLTTHLYWVWCVLTDAQKIHFGVQQDYYPPASAALAGRFTYSKLHVQTASLERLMEQLNQFSGLNTELLLLQWLYQFSDEETCL